MTSLFDRADFNERLFFPVAAVSPPPAGAADHAIAVEGARLHLRRYAGSGPTILLFHGNGECVADYDEAAVRYREAGARLAVVDFRGYGASTGEPTLRNALADARVVFDAVCALGDDELLVMGRSLGSACAAELAGVAHALIWESGFCDLPALVQRRGLAAPVISTKDRAAFDPLPKLERSRCPLLVLHGAEDELIAPSEAQRVFDAAGTSDKTLVYLRGRGHNDVSGAREYWQALASFVARVAVG